MVPLTRTGNHLGAQIIYGDRSCHGERRGTRPARAGHEGRLRRRSLLDSGLSAITTAKAYRLLRAILNTAADDGIIRRNPCRIRVLARRRVPSGRP